jgi:4-hydroxy-3-polyprenylbenzoate decarboxylase
VLHREPGHGPRTTDRPETDSALLIDATMNGPMPPLALPKREYMENAKQLWEKLGLPPLKPEMPWFGYSLGDWTEEWDRNAVDAAAGNWMKRSESYRQHRRRDVAPNTPTRTTETTGE